MFSPISAHDHYFYYLQSDAPFILKFIAGSLSGSIGAAVGNPFDVMKTKLQANAGKNIPVARLFGDLLREQGVGGFYRGLSANVPNVHVTCPAVLAGARSHDVAKAGVC